MKSTLLRMLATLMCALTAFTEVVPIADFDLQKMSGKWYMVGIATNAQWFVKHKAGMKIGVAIITPTEGGDMDLSYSNLNAEGNCQNVTHLANRTDTPGRFTFYSQVWNNDNDMRIADVVYDDYALVHTIETQGEVSEVLNNLYSRSTEVSEEIKRKFKQLSYKTGILADNIAFLHQNGECPSD